MSPPEKKIREHGKFKTGYTARIPELNPESFYWAMFLFPAPCSLYATLLM